MSNLLTDFWPRRWPSKKQWKKLPEILNKKEKALFAGLVALTVFSFFYSIVASYYTYTEIVPSTGGVYREGFVNSTRWLNINPVYASQSEVERDIIEVVFDGLMRYDKEGNLVPNIAKGYTTEDGQIFDVKLREDIYWSDGERLTAQDVLFTVKTIQSPSYQSTLRQQWNGVVAEDISEYEIRFILESPSSVFPENLTLKPIPYHIFSDYSPRDFRYSVHNIKPVSSGPYRFKEIKEDINGDVEYLKLERNPYYFRSTPYLNEVSFHFYRDVEELLRAQRRGEIDGFALSDNIRRNIPLEEIRGFNHHELFLPRYFSLFFNVQAGGITQEKNVRKALNYATDKEKILEEILGGRGYVINSPLLLEFYLQEHSSQEHIYNLERAKELLQEAGFKNGRKEPEDPFLFEEDLKTDSQGEEVRKLQECLLHLSKEDVFYEGEITGFFDEETREAVNAFQEKYYDEILAPHNFTSGTGMVAGSTREKLNELCEGLFNQTVALEITITTLDDTILSETAELLKEQWSLLGINTIIERKSSIDLKEEVIRPRNFQALLFGAMLPGRANPLPLWHSTKTDDPGMNLSGYESEKADKLLEIIISQDEEEKTNALLELKELIVEDAPGIFLYNPAFVYSISERIQGVEEKILVNSSKRFEDINEWYVNTKRVIKR
jgi:ABC-type transport system substrate-binding protein